VVRAGIRWVLPVALAVVLSGCSVPQGLVFVQDDRLTFHEPAARSTVTLPVSISWVMRDFTVTGPGRVSGKDQGYFGVFVDRAPVRPGQRVEAVVGHDELCRHNPLCPDEKYLADHGVYSLTDTTLTLDRLPIQAPTAKDALHSATVVLLDPSGRRLGEVAWRLEFKVRTNKRTTG
jgi:hypothetical protein